MENEFPKDDAEFTEHVIDKVDEKEGHYSIGYDGWGLGIGKDIPFKPEVGMTARFYGKGFGYRVRGVFLDGKKVWYRTEAEDAEHSEIELYGADAAEWLARWDAGRSVHSIEMGGLGPGYEQCIQITTAEILRHLLAEKYDVVAWTEDKDIWERDRDAIEKYGFANETITALGLSGAQWGAALSLATKLYMDGPRKIMSEPSIKDRHIQVSKRFPQAA